MKKKPPKGLALSSSSRLFKGRNQPSYYNPTPGSRNSNGPGGALPVFKLRVSQGSTIGGAKDRP